jgi:hypothetical protein
LGTFLGTEWMRTNNSLPGDDAHAFIRAGVRAEIRHVSRIIPGKLQPRPGILGLARWLRGDPLLTLRSSSGLLCNHLVSFCNAQ